VNLIFIGYRGTGKTVVSMLTAQRLGRERIGMDAVLVERFGMPIPDFVERNGWEAFRDAESALAEELATRDQLVIDCGGGVVVRDGNIEALRKQGRIVWLKASVATIAQRIGVDTQRPSLTGTKSFIEEIEEVLSKRVALYERACDIQIVTDRLAIDEIADQVLTWWQDQEVHQARVPRSEFQSP